MDSLDNTTLMLVAAVAVIVVAGLAWFAWQAHQTRRLKNRFGPEYDAVARRTGSRAKAEKELLQREKRRLGSRGC